MSDRGRKRPAKRQASPSRRKKSSSSSSPSKSRSKSKSSKSSKSRSSVTPKRSSLRSKSPASKEPNSVRLQTSSSTEAPAICPLHKIAFKYYCESREEPLCENCLQSGAYTNLGQRIVPLEEAYRYRLASIHNALNTQLYTKREQLRTQLRRIQFQSEEINREKTMIEHDIKNEMTAMLERLASASGANQAMLSHDITEITNDLDRINNIISTVESKNTDMVGFLKGSISVKDQIEVAIAKPFRSEIGIIQPLPREMQRIREMIGGYQNMSVLVKVRDDIIWQLIQDKGGVGTTSEKEITEWARLTDRFMLELEKFQLTCEHCHLSLSEESVNSDCSAQGNRKHRFIRKNPPVVMQAERDFDSVVLRIVKVVKEQQISIEALFRQMDGLNSGKISPTDLYQLLSSRFQLSSGDVDQLISHYDVHRTGHISYQALVADVNARVAIPVQKIGMIVSELLEDCKRNDFKKVGTTTPNSLRSMLIRRGLSSSEADAMMSLAEVRNGLVEYNNFCNKLKSIE